jgi:hypothetical protein
MQLTKLRFDWVMAACFFAAVAASPASGQYSTVGMGTRYTVVSAVNDSGEIVGSSNNIGSFDDVGYLIGQGGLPLPVGLALTQVGASSVDANGINTAGKIVGSYTQSSHTHGYLRKGETYKTLDYPGAVGTIANGVNDSDTIVGYYFDGTTYHGFQHAGGVFMTIDEPGATFTQIFGINNAGQIAGLYSGGDCAVATCGFVYHDGTFTQILAPGAIYTAVYGISNAGVVVGAYQKSGGLGHGFKESAGIFTDVDVPSADTGTTVVTGANSSGGLVGYYTKTVPGTFSGSVLLGFVKKP